MSQMCKSGEQVKTVFGTLTTPFPTFNLDKIKKMKPRGASMALAKLFLKIDIWLMENYLIAGKENNNHLVIIFAEQALKNPKNMSQSDKEMANLYLFGTI